MYLWSFCSLVDSSWFCFSLGDDCGDIGNGFVVVVIMVFFLWFFFLLISLFVIFLFLTLLHFCTSKNKLKNLLRNLDSFWYCELTKPKKASLKKKLFFELAKMEPFYIIYKTKNWICSKYGTFLFYFFLKESNVWSSKFARQKSEPFEVCCSNHCLFSCCLVHHLW